jgi:uncharacterized protein with NRDE domain
MCTVTFIPVKNKYFITSNRDEKYSRKKAIPPTIYNNGKSKLLFPKDANAGGTWIALHENGNAAVLLNGAFVKHAPQPPYEKSRGIILLEIIEAMMPIRFFTRMDLSRIEPFTLVVVDDNNLYECRWDANQKHCRQLRRNYHYIWSSSTLYKDDIAKKREEWFAAFLNKNKNPAQEDILHFHQFAGNGDTQNDLKISRQGLISTVSITSISVDDEKGNMKYLDLKENKIYEKEITFIYSLQDEVIY